MAAKKNHNYLIYFVIHDIVSVEVNAKDEEAAREKAQQIVDKAAYNKTGIDCIDGKINFAGIILDDEWNKIN